MKLIVFGHKRHGKDTACEHLRDNHGLSFASSSWYACQTFLFDQLKDRFGYSTPEDCFADRGNHRQLWYEAIRDYNAQDRTRLGRGIFAEHDVYCGIRDLEEFNALRQAGLFDLAVWIDASTRLPAEGMKSMNLCMWRDADVIIGNNGEPHELPSNLDDFMRSDIAKADFY